MKENCNFILAYFLVYFFSVVVVAAHIKMKICVRKSFFHAHKTFMLEVEKKIVKNKSADGSTHTYKHT